MIKRLFEKINKKFKEKKGASMAIVLTTMSLLIIMGTTFSTMAYNSYMHSYGTICRQQAMYTAKSILDGFVDEFIDNSTLRGHVGDALFEQVNDPANADKPITEVNAEINIAGLHNLMIDKNNVAGEENKSDCKMFVSYSDETRSKLRLMVTAKYKGFTNALSVILGYTNKASVELSKIMSNTLFFTSPIVDLMYYVDDTKVRPFKDFAINGDVYIDKPMWHEGEENPYTHISAVPNKEGVDYIATNGHTLHINNEGRPNILYDKDGYPVPELKDGKIQYLHDNDGNLIPLLDIYGNQMYEKDGKQAFILTDDGKDFALASFGGYEVDDKKYAIPLQMPKRDSSGKILDSKEENGQKILLVDDVKYRQNDNPGTYYGDEKVVDKAGRRILNTISGNADPMFVVDVELNGSGYNAYECDHVVPRIDDQFFIRHGDTWSWIEIFRTIDPVTKDEIYVTGRENNSDLGLTGAWTFTDRSFRRVINAGKEKPGALYTKRTRWKFVDSDGKVVGFRSNLDRYNIYKYQKSRATKSVDGLPMYQYVARTAANEWTEVYLRSHYWGGIEITNPMPVVIDGNLKCNTDVLLGLNNRSLMNKGIEGKVNGGSHGFQDPDGNIVPVAFDTEKDDYKLPLHNVLSLTGDIFVNGNAKGENIWVGGSLYAKDNNPSDDNLIDSLGYKTGCKGNVFLEQTSYKKFGVNLGAYMDIKGSVVADGYVFVGGVFGDITDKAFIGGDIHAGKYNADGSKWGNVGVGAPIPVDKFYMEDKSKKPIEQDKKANGNQNNFPAGIYGYRTNTEEVRFGKKNRYRLGSGDVVLQQTHVAGNIYATGDVYLSNGTWVDGSIYTPGNVYITKGDADISHSIEYHRDARCRVFGNIYAGGDVVVTGGCEIGDYKATKVEDPGYKSNIYCGGNFYSSGRITSLIERDCDLLSGSLYCAGDAKIYGAKSSAQKYTRLGYRGGDVIVKGDLEVTDFVALSNDSGNVYVGGNLNMGDHCALDNHGTSVVEGNFSMNGGYIHSTTVLVGGNLSLGGSTYIYKHANPTRYFVLGDISKIDTSALGVIPGDEETAGSFKFWCNGKVDTFGLRFKSDNRATYADKTPIPIDTNLRISLYGNEVRVVGKNGKFKDSVKPSGWELLNQEDNTIKINDATLKDLSYFQHMAYKNIIDSYAPLETKLVDYQNTVNAKIRNWTPPDSSDKVYKPEYSGEGINVKETSGGYKKSIFEDEKNANHFIIDDSVYNMPELTLLDGQRLTIDTSKKNIHIVLNSDLILGVGAKVEVSGKNMAFIYFLDDGTGTKIELGKNSSFGEVVGIDPNESANHSGLHIISTKKDFELIINEGAVVNSYNYLPRGILNFNLDRAADAGTYDAIIADPAGSYVINRIQGKDLRTMEYWRIKFLSKKSPLILDINGEINYGDSSGEITDFKGVEWVVVNYN